MTELDVPLTPALTAALHAPAGAPAGVRNLGYAIELEGDVDASALQQSLRDVVRRHTALRTAVCEGTPPYGRVHDVDEPRPHRTPVPGGGPDRAWMTAAVREAIAVDEPPSLRATLVPVATGRSLLMLSAPHAVVDAHAMSIVLSELAVLYGSRAHGRAPSLPPAASLSEFATWQERRLRGPELDLHRRYWRSALAGWLPTLDLRTARPRPPLRSYLAGMETRALGDALGDRVSRFASSVNASLFVVMLTAFKVLLMQQTEERTITVGTNLSGRTRLEHRNVVGNLTNVVLLRSRVEPSVSFRALVSGVQAAVFDALRHHELPFSEVLGFIQSDGDVAGARLFPGFNLRNLPVQCATEDWPRAGRRGHLLDRESGRSPWPAVSFAGARHRSFNVPVGYTVPNLLVEVWDGQDGVNVRATYNADLYDPATMALHLEAYVRLLGALVASPDRNVGR